MEKQGKQIVDLEIRINGPVEMQGEMKLVEAWVGLDIDANKKTVDKIRRGDESYDKLKTKLKEIIHKEVTKLLENGLEHGN